MDSALGDQGLSFLQQAGELLFLGGDQIVTSILVLRARQRSFLFDEFAQVRTNVTDFLFDLGEAQLSCHFGGFFP
jgi:hypothetical protein